MTVSLSVCRRSRLTYAAGIPTRDLLTVTANVKVVMSLITSCQQSNFIIGLIDPMAF